MREIQRHRERRHSYSSATIMQAVLAGVSRRPAGTCDIGCRTSASGEEARVLRKRAKEETITRETMSLQFTAMGN